MQPSSVAAASGTVCSTCREDGSTGYGGRDADDCRTILGTYDDGTFRDGHGTHHHGTSGGTGPTWRDADDCRTILG